MILAFIHHAHGVFEASNEEFDFFLTILTDLCREYIMQHESASWKEFKWWMVNTIGGELEYHEFFNDVGPFCFDSARTQLHLEWLNGKAMRSESVLSWTLMSKKLRSATQEIL